MDEGTKAVNPIIELRNIVKTFDDETIAVAGIHLSVFRGEIVGLLGPSGCGKTTTLRMLSGLEIPTEGEVLLEGDVVNNVPPSRRQTRVVAQEPAVYPHLSVYRNIAFGLEIKGEEKKEIGRRVCRASEMLRIEHLLGRYPDQLSGGELQRVALAEVLAFESPVILFDEPFASLDASLKIEAAREVKSLVNRLNITAVCVTHDQVEAFAMCDRIAVMHEGRVEQVGSPGELFDRPQTRFVAEFIGQPQINMFSVDFLKGKLFLPELGITPPLRHVRNVAWAGLRPHHIHMERKRERGQSSQKGQYVLEGEVCAKEQRWHQADVTVSLGERSVRTITHQNISAGDCVELSFKASDLQYFSQDDNRILSGTEIGERQ